MWYYNGEYNNYGINEGWDPQGRGVHVYIESYHNNPIWHNIATHYTTLHYTTVVGQIVLNRTVLALLYKPCWPGLVQLTSAQFYDFLHSQTNWADPWWPTKMCQCKLSIGHQYST